MTDIVIASAVRTPVGSFNGAFTNTSADELGAVAIKSALQSAKLDPQEVDEVILGQVLTAAQGQNPARQAAMKAGIPQEKTAWSLNQVCGSGLRAVALGMLHVASEDASIIVAGGQESMSTCTSCCPHACRYQDGRCETHRHDDKGWAVGCIPRLSHGHDRGKCRPEMADHPRGAGQVCGRLPEQGGSSSKGRPFQGLGRTGDNVPSRKGDIVVDQDEYIRAGTTLDAVTKLKPAFSKDGTVTAGNASGLNDGAAALVIMNASEAGRRGLTPLARIASWATAGVDPKSWVRANPGLPQGS